MRGGTYIIITDTMDPSMEFGEALSGSMMVTNNFRKAYDLALSFGEIADPDLGYKGALVRCNEEKAVVVHDKLGSKRVTIVLVKKF